MPVHRFDDDWFMAYRDRLLTPPRGLSTRRHAGIVRSLLSDSRLAGTVHQDTERAILHLAPRHASATRAHMQFYRACLESTGLVPSDALVNAAVQIEWLWYTTPFKPFYRDHLAHVMKVAATGLWLLEDEASPLAPPGGTLIDWLSERLARGEQGSEAIRSAAVWCGTPSPRLDEAFWKAAVLEAVRVAGLLHDMAYPDIMSLKVARAAAPVYSRPSLAPTEQAVREQTISAMTPHLAMAPFNRGRLPGPLPLADEDRSAAEFVFGESHSLRGAHALLRFMETTHRASPLDPFDTFVLEWAALAISLHDYDKLHEKASRHSATSSPQEEKFHSWLGKPENREALRPRFKEDPVSYVVALADQLQDFGRVSYTTATEQAGATPDVASLRLRYPCRAVELSTEGPFGELEGKVRFIFGTEAEQPFGIGHEEAAVAAGKKIPPDREEPVFGPGGWFDHEGLLSHLEVEVEHGSKVLARSAAARAGNARSPRT